MFENIINPVSLEEFFSEYYEKKHLVISRKNKYHFDRVLNLKMLDEMLFSMDLYHPENRVIDNSMDEFPDPKTYTIKNSKRIDPIKFTRYYAQGSTIVFSRAQDNLFKLRELTNKIGAFFKLPFQTNIYLTPVNSQGFAPHYDTHDVFILQFSGEKRWRIYDSTITLADKTQPFERGKFNVGKIVDEFTLHQGDTLYIPRGIMHDAFCEDSSSGHITLGLIGKTWAEHLAELILSESKNHIALRKHPKFHQSGTNEFNEAENIIHILSDLVHDLESNNSIFSEYYAKQKAITIGMLNNIEQINKLNLNSLIKFREKEQIRILEDSNSIELQYYDIKITLPANCKSFIYTMISSENEVSLKNIKVEIDEESRILLTKELIKNGIVEVCNWN